MDRAATTSTPLSELARSLSLTAKAWSTIKRVGACGCCAARLAGCRCPAAYECDERDLRAELDARFSCPIQPDAAFPMGSNSSTTMSEKCCPLCLGLLQSDVPLRMAPRARPSSESHGDEKRACVAETRPLQQTPPPRESSTSTSSTASASAATAAAATAGAPEEDIPPSADARQEHEVAQATPLEAIAKGCIEAAADKPSATAAAGAPVEEATAAAAVGVGNGSDYRRARMADAIAECATARGYTVSSFGITAAVPACLAARDAAFIAKHGDIGSGGDGDLSPATPPTSLDRSWAGAETAPGVVPVKEALKLRLVGGLRALLGGAAFDADSDFLVEVTAKAAEADSHAMTKLLGGPALSRSGPKPPGWPGEGRWAKKRQRREEHRNPGLTIGAVKKGLAGLDDEGRQRMRRWVDGLGGAGGSRKDAGGKGGQGGERGGGRGVGENVGGEEGVREGGGVDRAIKSRQEKEGGGPAAGGAGGAGGESNPAGNGATAVEMVCVDAVDGKAGVGATAPAPNATPADTAGRRSTAVGEDDSAAAVCEIAIRRQSIHFWGRYTKRSRSVPQTPWIKGFFSVQEAVSEPFEAFSGCVEGLLHGAGREDVDVRMLGKGRPFSLELVDSLRSADEVGARLPELASAVNAGTGRRNAGGGVAVSRLRVAGPGELPSDVQKVGEGKRKHYRCVVWVSRAVGREEVEAMCDRPELVVQQATPVRVLHRRTLLDRPRSIFDMRAEWINAHFFVLDLTTSAGTYIKEFVHGDLGRTVPSVGSLLNCRADILQLDVTNVEDKWSADENGAGSCSPGEVEGFPPRLVSEKSGGDVEHRQSSAAEGRGAG